MTDPDSMACWQRINPRLTTSGRLTADDPARLKAIGVSRVINLAMPDSVDALADEAGLMAEADIAYVHIPVPFDAPDESHFAAFCTAMEEAGEAPVHIHCILNWRVSAFVYRWNCMQGMSKDHARALMQVHWDPATSPHANAPAWAAFIGDA